MKKFVVTLLSVLAGAQAKAQDAACVVLAGSLICLTSSALGQSVQQSGSVTAGHAVRWVTNGVVGDAGTAAAGSLTSLGVTNNGGPGICVNSGAVTGPYNQLCLSVTTSGGSKISSYAYGGATQPGITFDINGSLQGFLTATLPVVDNHFACFDGTTGNIKDCAGSIGGLTVTNHAVAIGTGALGFRSAAVGTAGYALISNGASADPSFQVATGALFSTQSANLVLAGPTTGAAAVTTFRSLVVADIPTISVGGAPFTSGNTAMGVGAGTDTFTIYGQRTLYVTNLGTDPGCYCNTFVGNGGQSLSHTSGLEGRYNIGVGQQSLLALTTGNYNTATGFESMYNLTTGTWNTGYGEGTLFSVVSGTGNTAVGWKALLTSTDSNNTAVGYGAMLNQLSGSFNTAVGYNSLSGGTNNTGAGNTAVGFASGGGITTGGNNTFVGVNAGVGVTTAGTNTLIGYSAGTGITTGGANTVLGYNTGAGITTGTNNTIIGAGQTGFSAATADEIRISDGTGALGFRSDSNRDTYLGDNSTGKKVYNYYSAATNNAGTTADSGGNWGIFTGTSAPATRWQVSPVGGFFAATATGGDKGVGTVNATGYYINGASISSPITALTGDVTATGPGSAVATLANIPTGVPAAGTIVHTNIAAPSSPAAGKVAVYSDSTELRFHDKNASGTIGTTVVADTGASNNFLTAISAAGVISKAQPSISNLSGFGTGVATSLGVNVGTAGAFVVNGGALGSPSSAGTIPAYTLGGTVSGGGNQINNVVVGTSTPLAGSFTTLTGSTSTTTPLVIGGSGTTGTQIILKTTTGVGTTDALAITGGNNGATLFGTFNATNLNLPQSTASSNSTNGALVVAGGVGIAGNLNVAGTNMTLINSQNGATNFALNNSNAGASASASFSLISSFGTFTFSQYSTAAGGSTNLAIPADGSMNIDLPGATGGVWSIRNTNGYSTRLSVAANGQVTMPAAIASTSKTTGTLAVTGGVGVSGATFTDTLNVITMANAATTSAVCYNTGTGLLTYDGTVGTCTVSDERLKNMGPRVANALDKLLQINGVSYTWKDAKYGSGPQIGVGAQTVEKVFPELVQTGSDGFKSVDYQRLTAPIIEALRELKADNDNLRSEIKKLERKVK